MVIMLPNVLFSCLIGIIAIGGTIFWIWTIIDCTSNEPPQGNDKIVWLLVIIFTHLVGSLIYVLVRRPERRRLFGR